MKFEKIFKNSFFYRTPPVAPSLMIIKKVKVINKDINSTEMNNDTIIIITVRTQIVMILTMKKMINKKVTRQ